MTNTEIIKELERRIELLEKTIKEDLIERPPTQSNVAARCDRSSWSGEIRGMREVIDLLNQEAK